MLTTKSELTIIVTAYNNELYIRECLESIHRQTFQNYKVIVVEDNSTDNTKEVIKQFIAGKEKFQLVELTENSGSASLPRNTGIDFADTEYIMFIDGDDWYSLDACEKMVNAIKNYDSDLVCGQVTRTNTYTVWFHKLLYDSTRINFNLRQYPDLLYCGLSVNKIYKKEFLDKNNLRFLNGHLYEDILFISQAYLMAEKISIINEPMYYWRVVEDTEQKSVTHQRGNVKNFLHRIKIHDLLDEFMMGRNDHIYLQKKNQRFLKHDFALYLNDYSTFSEDYKEIFKTTMHTYLNKRLTRQEYLYIPEKNRIAAYLLHVGDFEAFEDYISVTNQQKSMIERIKSKGDFLYFHSEKIVGEEHFYLNMKKPPHFIETEELALTPNAFSFLYNLEVFGVEPNHYSCNFYLENAKTQTKHSLSQMNQNSKILLNTLPTGQFVLKFDLYVHNMVFTYTCKSSTLLKKDNLMLSYNKRIFKTYITSKNSLGLKIFYTSERKELQEKIGRLVKGKARKFVKGKKDNFVTSIFKQIVKKLPVSSKIVLFESHMGKQYSDSPKYIYESLKKEKPNMKYVWSFSSPQDKTLVGVTKVKRGSLKHLYYLNRAKYWVDNQGISHFTKKKKNQIYLQTWHGTPIKKMGHDQALVKSETEMKKLATHVDSWDYFVSPNPYSTEIFKRAFKIKKEILETGYPRNDFLVNQNNDATINELKERLGINLTKKVILFAPTFRDWDKNTTKTVNDISFLSKKLSNDYVIVLRCHYLVSEKVEKLNFPDKVINLSHYDDVNDLYLISDVLITDYSSVMFDYAILKRPILIYCYDYDTYSQKRGLYFDLKENSPGPFVDNLKEGIAYLESENSFNAFASKLENFHQKFCSLEHGNSTRFIIDKVFK